MKTLTVASIQLVSHFDSLLNRQRVAHWVAEAAAAGADWVLLPEYWPIMGRQDTDKLPDRDADHGPATFRSTSVHPTVSQEAVGCLVGLD